MKDLNLLKSIQKIKRLAKIVFALSKGPHLHRTDLVTVCKWGATAEYSKLWTANSRYENTNIQTANIKTANFEEYLGVNVDIFYG